MAYKKSLEMDVTTNYLEHKDLVNEVEKLKKANEKKKQSYIYANEQYKQKEKPNKNIEEWIVIANDKIKK